MLIKIFETHNTISGNYEDIENSLIRVKNVDILIFLAKYEYFTQDSVTNE